MLDIITSNPSRAPNFAPRREPLLSPSNCFVRLLTAKVIASITRRSMEQVAAEWWPSDRLVGELIERAASAPAMTSVVGWAAELAQRVVVDSLAGLGPVSAGAQLLQLGTVLNFDGSARLTVPAFVVDATDAAWVAEGDPIPVQQNVFGAVALDPHKLGSIAVLTREMIESSNAEQLVGEALTRAAGLALDLALFDVNAGTAARPSGLRNGIATLTASTNGTLYEAALEDISALFGAVTAVGGVGPYAIIVSPGRAATLSMRFVEEVPNLFVLGTPAVGTAMIVVAAQALVTAISPSPDVEISKAATVVMNDVGTPVNAGTPGAPARSLWQSDSIAVKIRWPVTWALRDPRAVAWMTPVYK